MLKRIQALLPAFVAVFWGWFYLAYRYHPLIDDSRLEPILRNQSLQFAGSYFRPVVTALSYLQGYFLEPSLAKAMAIGFALHLLVGWVAWKKLLPKLPEDLRPGAGLGLVAFLLHPVSLQTAVHAIQRGEILGVLFTLGALVVYSGAINTGPDRWQLIATTVFAIGATLSKESYGLIAWLVLTLLLARCFRGQQTKLMPLGLFLLAVTSVTLWYSATSMEFSKDLVQNQENYRKSRAFRQAVIEKRIISNEDSLILPIRDRAENLQLQTALLPQVLRIVFVPFGLVADYGHFPYGPDTYSLRLPWLWIGAGLALAIILALLLLVRSWEDRILIALPAALYGIFWVFPVYDPLVLYRLYGVIFLTFVISLPRFLRDFRHKEKVFAALLLLCTIGGITRGHEIQTPLRQARLELDRSPEHYRHRISYLHALIQGDVRPVNCQEILEPALTLAPSTSLIYTEWAWCLGAQGKQADARIYAQKALEQEAVPDNIPLIMNHVVGPGGAQFPVNSVHPANRKYIFPSQ